MLSAPLPPVATTEPGLFARFAPVGTPANRCPGRRRPLFTLFPLAFLNTSSLLAETPPWGFFRGAPKFEVLGTSQRFRLLEDFSYTDPQGRTWLAPAAAIIDGAILPRAFRSIIGGALEGNYRDAAIIHSVACDQKSSSWRDVHLTFYHALRCSRVDELTAKIIFYAAYHFGPRWGMATGLAEILSAFGFGDENLRPLVGRQSASDIVAWIEKTNPGLSDLQQTQSTAAEITAGR